MRYCTTTLLLLAFSVWGLDNASVYHIGNSWTDCSYGMHDIAKGFGKSTVFGRHMIPGAPLRWTAEHPNDGMFEPAPWPTALKTKKWDFVVLQPWENELENDKKYASIFAEAAYQGNPNAIILIMSLDYKQPATNAQLLVEYLKGKFAGKQFAVVPYGLVVAKVKQSVTQDLYIPGDGHPNQNGRYIMACSHYSTIFQADCKNAITSGLRYWQGPYTVDKGFAEKVWSLVWNEIQSSPFCKYTAVVTDVKREHFALVAPTSNATSTRPFSIIGRTLQPKALCSSLEIVAGRPMTVLKVR